MQHFTESGMTFGPYAEGLCFRVEQSDTYQAIEGGVKVAEFLLLRTQAESPPGIWIVEPTTSSESPSPPCLCIVEAKSSSPQPGNQPKFDEFLGEIREKLTNALSVGIASILNRHPNAATELPEGFKRLDLAVAGFRMVLIINGHQKDWLPPLQDALRRALHATVKTWALGPNAVVVLNHEGARQYGLTSAP